MKTQTIKLSFSDGSSHHATLEDVAYPTRHKVMVTPQANTESMRITDKTIYSPVDQCKVFGFSEIKIWGCTADYIKKTAGKQTLHLTKPK